MAFPKHPLKANRTLTFAFLSLILLNLFLFLHHPRQTPPPILHPLSTNLQTAHTHLTSLLLVPPARTNRSICREYDTKAQSCVYTGLVCINTTTALPRPQVYILDDTKPDFAPVPSDNWCDLRHQSSDPRYFSSRHWPLLEKTFAPQQSCLDAVYRKSGSLLPAERGVGRRTIGTAFDVTFRNGVRWLDSLHLVDLDYKSNAHNNHLLKDIIWLLDLPLFQTSLALPSFAEKPFPALKHLYLPQSRADFLSQTTPDINRLIYAIVLGLPLEKLYPKHAASDLKRPAPQARFTSSLLEVYPTLQQKLIFHNDILNDATTDIVCAPTLVAGAKIGNGAHERVCRTMRQRAHALYGIAEPEKKRLGRVYFPQPPKRIVVLQRHLRRGIGNLDAVVSAFRAAFGKFNVEVEVVSTADLDTAEQQVRAFARAGVVITPHGGQSMGQIWMPRHSSLIEIMPVGYTDYNFQMLSESCKIWYYELQSLRHPKKTEQFYKQHCGSKVPHMFSPCVPVKYVDVWVNIPQAIKTVRLAMERMGYPMEPWMQFVAEG